MMGIAIGAMALVVVLSAFNGIENLVDKLYSSFDPDIRISAVEGKTFSWDDFPLSEVREVEGVDFVSRSIEETVLLKHREAQFFVTLKGVDESFLEMSGLDSMLFEGELILMRDSIPCAIIGYGIADQLNVFINHVFEPSQIYAAKRTAKGQLNVDNAFIQGPIYASGIFGINPEFDYKYVLAPYEYSSQLLQHEGDVTSAEIGIALNANMNQVKERLAKVLGESFVVKTRFELNELLYKTNKTEKWITFLILSFILIIAAFNMIGSLTMLIIDKGPDLKVMAAMGMTPNMIKNVFLWEGILISLAGGVGGIVVGLAACYAQTEIGLLKLQEGTIAEYYPISVEKLDVLAVLVVVVIIGFLTSWFPAQLVAKRRASSFIK